MKLDRYVPSEINLDRYKQQAAGLPVHATRRHAT
jgi:hypothetical protein